MAKSVAYGFKGMNNLDRAPGILLDDAKQITPRIALNVEVQDGGKLVRRQGYALHIPLPGAHSLWAGSVMLAVAAGSFTGLRAVRPCPLGPCQAPRLPSATPNSTT